MLNSLKNIRNMSAWRYIRSNFLYGLGILGLMQMWPGGIQVVPSEEFVPAGEVTNEKGFYINNYRIPVESMRKLPGKELILPYDLIKNPEGGLDLLVDDPDMTIELRKMEGQRDSLEKKLEPSAKGKDGKDGLSLQGELAKQYKIKIYKGNEEYTLIIPRQK